MKNVKIIQTYSGILFRKAAESKGLDKVHADLENLSDILSSSNKSLRYLSAPIYSLEEKQSLIADLRKKLKLTKVTENLLDLLLENNKMEYLPDIFQDFSDRLLSHKGQVKAKLITAKKVSAKDLKSLTTMFEKRLGKKLSVTHEIDEAIIGGAILSYGNNMLDLSMLNMQNKLNREIYEV